MASGDRYQLIDKQTFLGQNLMNVYFYTQISGSLGAAELADTWSLAMIPLLIAVQQGALEHGSLAVVNIDDPDDWTELALTSDNVGLVGGDQLPPYCSWAFRYNRTSRAVRNGQKRIGGLSESSQDAGEASAGALTDLLLVAVGMGQNIDNAGGDIWVPKIFHKAPTPPGGPTPPLSDGTAYDIAGVQYVSLSTQNTRKFGRGS